MNDVVTPHMPTFGQGLQLSLAARAALSLDPVTRASEWTVTAATLTRMLHARGMPLHPQALDVEAAGGGALRPSGRHLGVFASLRCIEGRGALPPGEVDFPLGHRRMAVPQLLRDDVGPMLPLVVREDPEIWLDATGAVHLVNTDDDWGYREKAFDTFTRYVEVFAFLRESMVWPPEYVPPRLHRLFTESLVGEQLAEHLGAWPNDEGSGPTSRVWMREDLHVVQLTIPGFVVGTHVGTWDVADILTAISFLDPSSTNMEWQGPEWAGRAAWKRAGLPTPTRRFMHGGSAVHSWGIVPRYGSEMKKRRAGEAVSGHSDKL